jgi:hypothetical protein
VEGFKKSEAFKDLPPKEKLDRMKELQAKKPKNLAEQRAPYKARLRIVRSIMPRLLRDVETNEKICKTQDDIDFLSEKIGSSTELMVLLSSAYTRLAAKSNIDKAEGDELKNDLPPAKQESGS